MYKTLMNSIWDSVLLFRNNLLPLAMLVLPFAIVLEIIDAFYSANYVSNPPQINELLPISLLNLLIQPFYSVAIILYLSSIISNKSLSIKQAWLSSLIYWPWYLVFSVLAGLFVVTGLMLFIVPGIFLFIRFSFAKFYLVLEQQTPFTALRSSVINTKKYGLILFNGFILLGIATYGTYSLIHSALAIDHQTFSMLTIIIKILFDIITIIFTIFTFRIYSLFKETEVESS